MRDELARFFEVVKEQGGELIPNGGYAQFNCAFELEHKENIPFSDMIFAIHSHLKIMKGAKIIYEDSQNNNT